MTRHITDTARRNCPKCGKSMELHAVSDVAFQRCSGCSGLWMAMPDMERLMGAQQLAQAADTGALSLGDWTSEIEGELACPIDGSRLIRMVNHLQPHVQFESCKVCGCVFLDAGELRDLASYTLLERLRKLIRRVQT